MLSGRWGSPILYTLCLSDRQSCYLDQRHGGIERSEWPRDSDGQIRFGGDLRLSHCLFLLWPHPVNSSGEGWCAGLEYLKGQLTGRAASISPPNLGPPPLIQSIGFTSKDYTLSSYSLEIHFLSTDIFLYQKWSSRNKSSAGSEGFLFTWL